MLPRDAYGNFVVDQLEDILEIACCFCFAKPGEPCSARLAAGSLPKPTECQVCGRSVVGELFTLANGLPLCAECI